MRLRPAGVVIGVVTGCLALAACGERRSMLESSGGNAQRAAAVDRAKALVAKYKAMQPPVSVPRSTEPIPRNVRLAIQGYANSPSSEVTTAAAVAAAKALGWRYKVYYATMTPEGYQSSWSTILQDDPTAIFTNPVFPNTLVAAQLKQARERDIPIVTDAPETTDEAPADGIRATVNGARALGFSGKLMGATVVADADGPADTLFVYAPAFEGSLKPIRTEFTKEIKAAGGQVSTLEVSAADIGQAVPGQVVNFLQRNPQAKYVAFVVSQVTSGVSQALASADLADKVKIVSPVPQAANVAAVKQGQEFAVVANENSAAGWRGIDNMLRILTGEGNFDADPIGWQRIFFKDNVTDTSEAPRSPGVPEAYLKAWGVDK